MNMARKRASVAAATVLAVLMAAAPVPLPAEQDEAGGPAVGARADGSNQDGPSLAESYLSRLSKKSRSRRLLAGGLGLGLGGIALAGGLALQSKEDDSTGLDEDFGALYLISGGAMAVTGMIALGNPSPAERAYKKVLPLEDAAAREAASAKALADLARRGRRSRLIFGGLLGAVGIGVAVAHAHGDTPEMALPTAISYGGLALYRFLVRSLPEKTYRAYLEQSGVGAVPDLVLGFGPRGGLRAGLSLDF